MILIREALDMRLSRQTVSRTTSWNVMPESPGMSSDDEEEEDWIWRKRILSAVMTHFR